MTHEKLVAGTSSPTRYTKIIRNPGAGTKYNRTYQETDYVSRYTKVVAGGKDYVPPAPPEPPEPEYEELAVATKSKNADDNIYEIGNMVAFTTATYTGGTPDSNQYRWRVQERDTSSDSWVNGVWSTYDNTATGCIKELRKGGQLRFQCQARDTSQNPVPQVNSFGSIVNIPFPPLVCEQLPTISGDLYPGSTLYCTKAVYSGGMPPVVVESQIQISDTGEQGTWSGVDAWGEEENGTHLIGPSEVGKYFRVSGRGTDSSENAVSLAETTQSFSEVIGPVVEKPTIGDVYFTVNDIDVRDYGAMTLLMNDPVPVEAFFDGDATPAYEWSCRGDYPLMVGEQAKHTYLTFPEEGMPTVQLRVYDPSASDTPVQIIHDFYIVDAKTMEELKTKGEL